MLVFKVDEGTCYKVPKPNGGQGDDHKVEGLQRRPALDVFKDGRRQRHEEQAAEKHKEQGGDDPDLRLTDVPVLRGETDDPSGGLLPTPHDPDQCSNKLWQREIKQTLI